MASMASMGFTVAHGEKPTASERQRCCHQTRDSHQHTISSAFRQCLHCWQENIFSQSEPSGENFYQPKRRERVAA